MIPHWLAFPHSHEPFARRLPGTFTTHSRESTRADAPPRRHAFLAAPAATDRYRACANSAQYELCNWMVPERDPDPLCPSCRLNNTIPDLTVAGNQTLWQRLETQKRRLVRTLMRLGLPVQPRKQHPAGLAFDFLADPDPAFSETGRVLTGHADGLITLNIAEADPATRERMRQDMVEPYRTILGHFRHESGHYYWDRLVRDGDWLAEFRPTVDSRNPIAQPGRVTVVTRGPPASHGQPALPQVRDGLRGP